MVHDPDVIIPPTDGPFSFRGEIFQIIHTPGHSAGHICTITPDNVCYAADALLSQELLKAKLPYSLSHKLAIQSREKLRNLSCDYYIIAHRGICTREEIEALIDGNQALVRRRAGEILALIDRPMPASQVVEKVCALHQLFTHKPRRSLRFERNIRFFLEYLVDTGRLSEVCENGVTFYTPTT